MGMATEYRPIIVVAVEMGGQTNYHPSHMIIGGHDHLSTPI